MHLFAGLALLSLCSVGWALDATFAVDCGGAGDIADSNGIKYTKDATTFNRTTSAANVTGCAAADAKLYQSYIWNAGKVSVDVPVPADGKYVLVLKMLTGADARYMTVVINDEIYVGVETPAANSSAYDEQIFFTVCKQKLLYKDGTSALKLPNFSVQLTTANGTVQLSALAVVPATATAIPSPNIRSKEAEVAQVYQKFAHKCESEAAKAVAAPGNATEKVPDIGKILPTTIDAKGSPLSFSFSNFSFTNLNIFAQKSDKANN
jgi:Malectin domain